ncbi:DegT/DnrJ/EryC1/StrS family aminotransferase [Helicobacter sp. 13S00477-4]|uniref:DegT/DnrJ/EryC1/StrS family aminotransferase n=1 Tax=Helicobacter sp. 13S00477-4 TaxID=1905759 RepID=UPI000BA719E6|nr:DegT/DnrJ/EryC1/StrS family aminotransferase [Helicobacter sp. 13S00477-4]PAF51932.1 aminotransferase DegT [Helicobacter sp. 13S00477-4]
MKIDFANLLQSHIEHKDEIQKAISKTIENSSFIMGKEVEALENELSTFVGCKYAITCSSGTSAILLALLAIDLQAGDEVITTPFSFIAAAEMIAFLGAKPVFVDINPYTFQIDEKLIEPAINQKTKAIIPVSLFGQVGEMDSINTIAKKHNLIVIEDGAQSFGAEYKNKKSCNLTTLATTSFFPAKPLGCYGDGGAVFCNNASLAKKIKSLRIHGQTKRYNHQYIGIGARLDGLQASILRIKLKYYVSQIAKRQQIAKLYKKYLVEKNIILPKISTDVKSIYAQYCIRSSKRKQIEKNLQNCHIPYAIHYPKPLHLQKCFDYLEYKKGDFPIAEKISKEILSLPMNPYLKENEIKYICTHLL